MKPVVLFGLLVAVLVSVVLWMPRPADDSPPAVAEDDETTDALPPSGGMSAQIDPETGEFTDEPADGADRGAVGEEPQGTVRDLPGGGSELSFPDGYRHTVVGTAANSDSVTVECVPGESESANDHDSEEEGGQ